MKTRQIVLVALLVTVLLVGASLAVAAVNSGYSLFGEWHHRPARRRNAQRRQLHAQRRLLGRRGGELWIVSAAGGALGYLRSSASGQPASTRRAAELAIRVWRRSHATRGTARATFTRTNSPATTRASSICLPALLGTFFYSPSQEGYEAQVKDQPARWREAQRKASTTVEWVLARCVMATRPVVERPRRPADRSGSQTISECGRVPVPLARPADTDGQNSTHPRRRSP